MASGSIYGICIQSGFCVVQQSAASAEEMASSAQELSSLVDEQREAISFFKLEEGEMQQANATKERREHRSTGALLRGNAAAVTKQPRKEPANKTTGIDLDMGDEKEQFVKY